jgi:hypothetical protein
MSIEKGTVEKKRLLWKEKELVEEKRRFADNNAIRKSKLPKEPKTVAPLRSALKNSTSKQKEDATSDFTEKSNNIQNAGKSTVSNETDSNNSTVTNNFQEDATTSNRRGTLVIPEPPPDYDSLSNIPTTTTTTIASSLENNISSDESDTTSSSFPSVQPSPFTR